MMLSTKALAARPSRRALSVRASSVQGKNVFITGGNTGIGYETALTLAREGAKVTIAARDANKAANALAQIRAAVPSAAVDSLPLDLSDLVSVSDCAKRVADSGVAYDVWINNAGVMATPKMSTAQGFEYQLGVNHLGHFALTTAVLPALQAANKPVRVINVASAAHMFGKIDFDDLMRDRNYDAWEAYGQSKLANVMFTYEMARRVGPTSPITVNALHPGVVKTELGRYMIEDDKNKSNPIFPVAMELMKLFMLEPIEGAATSLYLASSPEAEGITGKYWVKSKRAVSSNDSYNRQVAQRLWEVSEELVETALAKARSAPAAAAPALEPATVSA
ncbi:hypothetical protein CHLRE_09g398252v5 [Chlamydomonas reinhardtii]|uniref:Uncharacterized protein n=1 Tax=Chlamydomonas reinhardtii TaxID=3055 RepID=A0A2K3DES2_CHLRE|nr:uncharacterized protein CHLRE_09g398252v5 [Chlamydomonas reinhardtii]PNW79029.1 hypothetical protein CHLRE_09g398252v5 [Chlamydomonas reinhardtii]